jgi:hypothetical protein
MSILAAQMALVLNYIKDHECCTKDAIAEGTGLSLSEVGFAVGQLRSALTQIEECDNEGQYRVPKPPKEPLHSRR